MSVFRNTQIQPEWTIELDLYGIKCDVGNHFENSSICLLIYWNRLIKLYLNFVNLIATGITDSNTTTEKNIINKYDNTFKFERTFIFLFFC